MSVRWEPLLGSGLEEKTIPVGVSTFSFSFIFGRSEREIFNFGSILNTPRSAPPTAPPTPTSQRFGPEWVLRQAELNTLPHYLWMTPVAGNVHMLKLCRRIGRFLRPLQSICRRCCRCHGRCRHCCCRRRCRRCCSRRCRCRCRLRRQGCRRKRDVSEREGWERKRERDVREREGNLSYFCGENTIIYLNKVLQTNSECDSWLLQKPEGLVQLYFQCQQGFLSTPNVT